LVKLADQLERLQLDRLQLERVGVALVVSVRQEAQLQLERDQPAIRLPEAVLQLERLQLDRV
jgi:hypothetical protein